MSQSERDIEIKIQKEKWREGRSRVCALQSRSEILLSVSFLSRSSGFGEGDVSVTRGDVM